MKLYKSKFFYIVVFNFVVYCTIYYISCGSEVYFKTLGQYDCQINVMQCLLVVAWFFLIY